ncbi:MAG: hypothetical protein Q9220_002800 [cf. Caloplaca sp. 1 TL-2023]
MCCSTDIFLALLAVLFPPLAVWIKSGLCTIDSLLNILLCVLGYLPGLLHAWYIIAKYPSPDTYYESPYSSDIENQQQGHVTYYYVSDGRTNNSTAGQGQQQQYPSQSHNSGRGYGTVQGMRAQPQPQPRQSQQQQGQSQQQGRIQQQRQVTVGEGSSQAQQQQGVPPSYEQAISGDNKVQT